MSAATTRGFSDSLQLCPAILEVAWDGSAATSLVHSQRSWFLRTTMIVCCFLKGHLVDGVQTDVNHKRTRISSRISFQIKLSN